MGQSDFTEILYCLHLFSFNYGIPTVLHYLLLMAKNSYRVNNNVEELDLVLALKEK